MQEVNIKDLKIGENSRLRVDATDLSGLMSSIEQRGIIQPITARQEDRMIICGNRRFVAAKKLGFLKVPVIFRKGISDKELLMLNLIENIQRKNINSIEIGRICNIFLTEQHLTLGEIATRLNIPVERVKICITAFKRTPEKFRDKIIYQKTRKQHNKIPENVFWQIIRLETVKKLSDDDFDFILTKALEEDWVGEEIRILHYLYRNGFTLQEAIKKIEDYVVINPKIAFVKKELYKDMQKEDIKTITDYIRKIINKHRKNLVL